MLFYTRVHSYELGAINKEYEYENGVHLVKKHQLPKNEQKELISIGTIGLIKDIAMVDTEQEGCLPMLPDAMKIQLWCIINSSKKECFQQLTYLFRL